MTRPSDQILRAGARLGRQPAIGRRWMVSTPNSWATLEGARVLADGGNAVDAALAISALLMVAVPHQTSPGGDAFWLIKMGEGQPIALNASGRSASLTNANRLRSKGLTKMPERDGVTVTVPGVVPGWHCIAERFATRRLPELVRPAIRMAFDGLPVTPYVARQFLEADSLLASRPESDRIYRPAGRPVRVGELLRLPELGDSLESAAASNEAFTSGDQARAIVEAVQAEGGELSLRDLSRHQSTWMDTVHLALPASQAPPAWTLHELGPNSQGWLAIFMLELADRLSRSTSRSERTRAAIQAATAAIVLRAAVLADAEHMVHLPTDFLDATYLDRAAAALASGNSATAKDVARALDVPLAVDMPSTGDTVHFAAVDPHGNAISCIQSLYFDFGTGIVPPGLGFALQNRGAGFSLWMGHPNDLGPGKRPMHTLSPAMAVGVDGTLRAVLGSMGGDAQTQIHVQLLQALRDDLDPARATSLPRWFVRPSNGAFEVLAERRGAAILGIEKLPHTIRRVRPWDELMGHAQLILRLEDGTLLGAADPRSDGLALGL